MTTGLSIVNYFENCRNYGTVVWDIKCVVISLYTFSENVFLRKVFGGLRRKCMEVSSVYNVCVNASGSNRPYDVPTSQRNAPIKH